MSTSRVSGGWDRGRLLRLVAGGRAGWVRTLAGEHCVSYTATGGRNRTDQCQVGRVAGLTVEACCHLLDLLRAEELPADGRAAA